MIASSDVHSIVDEKSLLSQSSVYLQSAFNALCEAENHSQTKHQYCNPESIPLNLIAFITPPLRQIARFRFIEDLFQYD